MVSFAITTLFAYLVFIKLNHRGSETGNPRPSSDLPNAGSSASACLYRLKRRHEQLLQYLLSTGRVRPDVIKTEELLALALEFGGDDSVVSQLRTKAREVSDVEDLIKGNSSKTLGARRRGEIFTKIYKANAWGSKQSRSGFGSERHKAAPAARCVGEWIIKYNIKSFLDLPCGDANWQPEIPNIGQVHYVGMDIVEEAVLAASKSMSDVLETGTNDFRQHDIAALPMRQQFDVILHRDVIQHLSYQEALQVLAHFQTSGSTYLIISTHPTSTEEAAKSGIGISNGEAAYSYRNNMQRPPFNFPPPMEMCDNYVDDPLSKIALWEWDVLPNFTEVLKKLNYVDETRH